MFRCRILDETTLKEHELGVRLKEAPEGSGPYVPKAEK
jgi:hypothetical protein